MSMTWGRDLGLCRERDARADDVERRHDVSQLRGVTMYFGGGAVVLILVIVVIVLLMRGR